MTCCHKLSHQPVLHHLLGGCLFVQLEDCSLATHKSAIKRYRQSLKRRQRNRTVKGGVRAAVKRTRMAVTEGDIEAAQASLQIAISRLDRAASKGVLHKNTAARSKGRLTKLVNQAAAE